MFKVYSVKLQYSSILIEKYSMFYLCLTIQIKKSLLLELFKINYKSKAKFWF